MGLCKKNSQNIDKRMNSLEGNLAKLITVNNYILSNQDSQRQKLEENILNSRSELISNSQFF